MINGSQPSTFTKDLSPALFVTGTDTEVGKTYVCGALLRYLLAKGVEASYQKWIATGTADISEDFRQCMAAAGLPLEGADLHLQVPYRFLLPASPHLAAEQERRWVDPEVIVERFQKLVAKHRVLIVEGVGGVLVPLNRDLLLGDFLARLRLPTLVVARSGLGTLNHTLLTLEALRSRRIPVLGVVLSDAAPVEDELLVNDNLKTIAEMGKVRVFGRIERDGAEAAEPVWRAIVEAMTV
jgi:dethiobiotin synthetase